MASKVWFFGFTPELMSGSEVIHGNLVPACGLTHSSYQVCTFSTQISFRMYSTGPAYVYFPRAKKYAVNSMITKL